MELINATDMVAGYTMGMKPDGRESIVVVVKGTFTIPATLDEEPELAAEQVPLVMADQFTGEPGFSAPFYESDFCPFKPRCDILLNGSAYAPGAKPTKVVRVSLKVGEMQKAFNVVGNRVWQQSLLGTSATPHQPLTVMPISYDNAFGGLDETDEEEARHSAYVQNPVGAGYHNRPSHSSIVGRQLPNTEEIGRPVTDARGKYRPMSFGPIARSWQPRLVFAGTYDDKWFEDKFPFLPDDFDERYYQSAPEDQQVDCLQGGEEVELINLTPDSSRRFRLPQLAVPVEFVRQDDEFVTNDAVLDTLILEPDENRFILCWRTSIPLRKNMFEVPMGIVGRMPRGWYRARSLGKAYYDDLQELIRMRTI